MRKSTLRTLEKQSTPEYENLLAHALESKPNAKALTDMIKALNLLKFIELNMDWVLYAVDNRQDLSVYRFPDDQRKGVLRDFDGTSFHLNSYTSAKQAHDHLVRFIDQFKAIIKGVLQADEEAQRSQSESPLPDFVNAFAYENSVGCMEARLAGPIKVGERIVNKPDQTLPDLLSSFYEQTPESQRTISQALTFLNPYIGSTVFNDKCESVILTRDIIVDYCRDTLFLEEETPEPQRTHNRGSSFLKKVIHFFTPSLAWRISYAIEYKPEKYFLQLILLPEATQAINQILVDNSTILWIAAEKQSEKAFCCLVEKASAEALNEALVKKTSNNSRKTTALHLAAQHQSEKAFCFLVKKTSAKALNKAVCENYDGCTPLNFAAKYQSEKAFFDLVKKISTEALNKALTYYSVIDILSVTYRSNTILQLILAKTSDKVIRSCFSTVNLYYHIVYHPSETVNTIISKFSNNEILKLFHGTIGKLSAAKQNNFYKALSKHLCDPHMSLRLSHLLTPLSKQLYPYLEKQLFDLKISTLNVSVAIFIINYLVTVSQPNDRQKLILKEYYDLNKNTIEAYTQHLVTLLPDDEQKESQNFNLTDLLALIEQKNITIPARLKKEIVFYRSLEKTMTATEVATANSTISRPSFFSKPPKDTRPVVSETIEETIQSHNALIKVIKQEDWGKFIKQLEDYSYRPPLRAEKTPNPNHVKYVHLTGEVVPTRLQKPLKDAYGSTKKSSATSLSSKLNTELFGHHVEDRDVVGLLFDARHCTIKAMMSRNLGTYRKDWVGDDVSVKNYVSTYRNRLFKDFQKFTDQVRNSSCTNEVLAKYTRESLKAVVIARETPGARQLAEQYASDIETRLGIKLPIICYDPIYQSMTPLQCN